MESLETERLLEQERLLPFLSDPESYPWNPENVHCVQTHASFVFLAEPFVYKIKKAVDFGFLDYSTLEKRRHFCEREIELNRRLSHDVYLGVIPISRTADGFALDGEGEVVEYAVKMRLLDEEGFLDGRVDRGLVTKGDLDRLSRTLGKFYNQQHPTHEIEERGRVPTLKVSTDENFTQVEPFVGNTLSQASFETLRHYTDCFFTTHGELFDRRVREGRILDCHGDLRLEHVHLSPDTINVYDCIEFNDRFRYVDVASEAAFLAMDLELRHRWKLSRHFVRMLSTELKDPDMGRLMVFYKCYRAFVRGKVESFQGVAHAVKEGARVKRLEAARCYFSLALQYAVSGLEPLVIVCMGPVASGKSTLAARLGETLGWEVISSDRERKEMAGVSLHERGSVEQRRRLYSTEMSEKTYAALLDAAGDARPGQAVILDATYSRRTDRDNLIKRLEEQGIDCFFLEARAGEDLVRSRLEARESEALVISDARVEDFGVLIAGYESPDELSPDRCVGVDTSKSIADSLTMGLRSLAEREVARV